jgi:hypothetical protein
MILGSSYLSGIGTKSNSTTKNVADFTSINGKFK